MWVVAYGISIQTACHLISSWQFLWANHSENESAWIWTDRSQPGRYSSWQCVCTATVANANCNACWVADIFIFYFFIFCLVHIIGTQHDNMGSIWGEIIQSLLFERLKLLTIVFPIRIRILNLQYIYVFEFKTGSSLS